MLYASECKKVWNKESYEEERNGLVKKVLFFFLQPYSFKKLDVSN
jgi:hypothetical protein